jgi:hypothetical protein
VKLGSAFVLPVTASGQWGRVADADRRLDLRGISGAAGLLFAQPVSTVTLSFGVGARVGYLELSGETSAGAPWIGRDGGGVFAGPQACAQLFQPFGTERFGVILGVDVGFVTAPIKATTGEGETFFSYDGSWVRGHLGFAFSPFGS